MPAAGMAEVVFKYKDDALEAFKKYNQRNLDGQPMVCRVHPTSRSRLSGYGHRCVYGIGVCVCVCVCVFEDDPCVPSYSYSDDLYAPHSGFY